MILTYDELIKKVSVEGFDSVAKKVSKVALSVFEPLDDLTLSFSLPSMQVKPFSSQLNKVPIFISHRNRFIIGSQLLPLDDSLNLHYPGDFSYGGAFLIEDLINKKPLTLKVVGYPNDIYEKTEVNQKVSIKDVEHAVVSVDLLGKNEFVAHVNSSDTIMFSENGAIRNDHNAINFRRSGIIQLIFELKERVSSVFMAGATGNAAIVNETLTFSGAFAKMDTLYNSALSLKGYGVYSGLGIGVLVDVDHDPSILKQIVANELREYSVIDVATRDMLGTVTLEDLKKPIIEFCGHRYKTGALTSFYLAKLISERTKEQFLS
jgi:uncharacterized protein (DUF39 family)